MYRLTYFNKLLERLEEFPLWGFGMEFYELSDSELLKINFVRFEQFWGILDVKRDLSNCRNKA